MLKFWVFFCCLYCLICALTASATVVLIGNNVTLSFEDIEASFAASVEGSRKCGMLHVAEPSDACSPLTNNIVSRKNDTISPFVLIIRGGCSFEDKVRRAQAAGFKAAIVYDYEDADLVPMAGDSDGIKINAVFVSQASGETLAKYAGAPDVKIWIITGAENSIWHIIVISIISLLSLCALMATCFFARRRRIRRERPRAPRVREFHGMSSRLVKAMPSLIFTAVLEDNCTSATCAICLEDYDVGEKLRVLPCLHKFHALCVDAWLTTWRTFCPVCKRDARTYTGEPPASESTPLLSSNPSFVSSSPLLSSFRSSQLGPSSQLSPLVSGTQSIFSTFYDRNSLHSHLESSHLSISQSSIDFRNLSLQRSNSAYFVSSDAFCYPSLSSLSSRHMSLYVPSPGNGSSSYLGSSSRQLNARHYSEPDACSSPFDSSHSLPEC